MEFWGVEVSNGEPLEVVLESDRILHVSHISLGENKKNKGSEPIYIYLKFKGQKFVLATLSHEKFPQTTLDLVLDKDFELSHSWKNGSVYCTGYQIDCEEDTSDMEDEDHQMSLDVIPKKAVADGEKAGAKEGTVKSDTAVKQVNFKEPNKAKNKQEDDSSDEDEDEDEDMSSDEESSDDKAPIANGGDGSDGSSDEDESDEDDSESSDYETPTKKPASSKKRPVEPEVKTPVDNKKAKLSTPQKTDKKVSGHVATPYPSKQAGKKPTSSEPKSQTPKAAGTHLCKTCSRTFTTDIGLQSHTKAKHGVPA